MSKGKPRKTENTTNPEVGYSVPVALPQGWASVVLSGGRLVSVEWESTRERLTEAVAGKYPRTVEILWSSSGGGEILKEYAGGGIPLPREILALPFAWEEIGGFHRRVLRETAGIPYGRTATYGEIAARAGSPAAARAAGAALARNPWPILIPCHRVVGVGGKLVGFGKGLPVKEALIRFEERNLLLRESCPLLRQNV